MNTSYLNTQGIINAANLCQDPETKGFDLQAGQSWIYPTNYPVREYQFNIIQEALHKNTLVSLPTGLGKTFIAAVIMYNFYRWYPHKKVIFMAPTRPLVKQQMDACYNIMAIPQDVTAELTGSKIQQSRTEIWNNKRVFFITPQVLQNDLNIIIELGVKIKCLVFDEAHRAKGNHAYCEVIRKLLPKNKLFRVLALSATPGNSSRDVIEVMQNLLIAHVEFRSEESPDVKPYVFERALETVVVPLGEKLQEIKDRYIQILEKYTKTLIQYEVIYGNCCNLTKGKIFMVMKEFQAKNSGSRTPHYGEIMKSLNICITLYHAYETLIRCGLRAFLNFYEEHINNPLLSGNIGLRQILDDLKEFLGPSAEVQRLPDGSFAQIPSTTKFGHPKFYKLRDILVSHFQNLEESTRVIVFFEYRESASEAYTLLIQNFPLIRPRVFVGQGSGVTQRDQINTVRSFREGDCNTLLSTCIGEEGLDVGDVDLIVCFDIANKSPIRMIQRMGRTGRKKEGRVVVLVTEGKEQQTLKECLIYKSNLGNFVANSEQLEQGKYTDNPKMIPSYVKPKCQKMFITVKKPIITKKTKLKDMLKSMTSDSPKLDDVEVIEISERLNTKIENFWNKENPLNYNCPKSKIIFDKHLEKQRGFQNNGIVKQSKQTEIFVSLLQFADSKRYNIPVTQNSGKFRDFSQNKFLKQVNIKDMFSKATTTESLSQEISSSQTSNFDKEKDVTQSFPVEFFEEISYFLSIQMEAKQSCKTCDFLFECPKLNNHKPETIDLSNWVQPDLCILNTITAKDIEVFAESLSPKSKKSYVEDLLDIDNDIFENVTFEETKEKSFHYDIPRNFDHILDSFRICPNVEDGELENIQQKSFTYETPKSFGKILNLLEISGAKEVKNELEFAKPSLAETPKSKKKICDQFRDTPKILNVGEEVYRETFTFFKLSSLEDVFESVNSDESYNTIIYTPDLDQDLLNNKLNDPSPDLFGESPDLFASTEKEKKSSPAPESPILCTFDKALQIKAKRKLFESTRYETTENIKKPNLGNLKFERKSFFQSTRNSPKKSPKMDITDLCDLSDFGLTNNTLSESRRSEDENKSSAKENNVFDDFCEFTDFDLNQVQQHTLMRSFKGNQNKAFQNKFEMKQTQHRTKNQSLKRQFEDVCDLDDSELTSEMSLEIKPKKEVCKIGHTEKQNDNGSKEDSVNKLNRKQADSRTTESLKWQLDDLCDFDDFELSISKIEETKVKKTVEPQLDRNKILNKKNDKEEAQEVKNTKNDVDFDISDLCDLSIFGLAGSSQSRKDQKTGSVNDQIITENLKSKVVSELPEKKSTIDLSVEDLCDMSDFFGDSFFGGNEKKSESKKNEEIGTTTERSVCGALQSVKNSKLEVTNLIDLTESPEKINTSMTNKNINSIIDLTDSDFESSPVRNKPPPKVNKTPSQLSITQMLSQIKKTEIATNNSQKENSTPSPRTQKPTIYLATKKGICQNSGTPRSSQKKLNNENEKNKNGTPKKQHKQFNISLAGDSDDEFEDSCKFNSPIFTKPKTLSNSVKTYKNQKSSTTKESKKRKKLFSDFIEEEAEVSEDEKVSADEYEDNDDCYEASFVTDETQDILNTTSMHAKYLQSVKSPIRGKFKIPQKPKFDISNVFSQEVANEDDSYLDDTFCVNNEDVEDVNDISELELLEMKLEKMKKNKRKKKPDDKTNAKRRRILVPNDDSD